MKDKILKEFSDFGLPISEKKAHLLFKYYELLIEENKKVNLTAITDFDEVLIKHFLDSAALLRFYPNIEETSIIDVGCGAGFPGMVLSIMCPGAKVTLLESVGKKTSFLEEVKSRLVLSNVSICTGRAEEYGNIKEFREKFDIATSRAVARLDTLLEYLMPFVKVGGRVICYKGSDAKAEIKEAGAALLKLGGEDFLLTSFDLPKNAGERAFVYADKKNPTPKEFPRRVGLPSKRPITLKS